MSLVSWRFSLSQYPNLKRPVAKALLQQIASRWESVPRFATGIRGKKNRASKLLIPALSSYPSTRDAGGGNNEADSCWIGLVSPKHVALFRGCLIVVAVTEILNGISSGSPRSSQVQNRSNLSIRRPHCRHWSHWFRAFKKTCTDFTTV